MYNNAVWHIQHIKGSEKSEFVYKKTFSTEDFQIYLKKNIFFSKFERVKK